MTRILRNIAIAAAALLWGVAGSSCADHVDFHRIPGFPVQINLANQGLWATYGVSGVGAWREFIKDERLPSGFPYTDASRTGFGGVLIIGTDAPATGDFPQAYMPVAYDLSCPVEVKQNVRIYVDEDRLEGVCPVCGSRYSLLGGGFPISGEAAQHDPQYGLTSYRCAGTNSTGYMILN